MSKKNTSTEEDDFVYAALEENPGRLGRYVVYLVLLLISAALAWAAYFELDEVATASGKVIPSSRGQVIQVLETGILSEMNVHEGDRVTKGQVLLKLDDTRAGPNYREAFNKWQALLARATRLRSEAYDFPLSFPPEVLSHPELVKIESGALKARRGALDQQMAALNNQRDALVREVELTEPLVKQGVVSEVELLRLKRQAAELEGQMASLRTGYLSRASEELVQVDAELGQISESLIGHKEALARTTVYSPTNGVVSDIAVNTIGGVINSGQVIMDIVPVDDDLLVEVFMPPTEVAHISLGQKAQVKLSAYDARRYGNLDGVVALIGADVVIEDSKGGSNKDSTPVNLEPGFYRVLVKITNPGVERNGMKLIPKTGMTATVDILTGSKTVLDYVIKPMQAVKDALRER